MKTFETPANRAELARMIDRMHPTILEIGAHNGNDGRVMAAHFKGASLYQFEPDPRFQGEGIIPLAITDTNGYRDFHISKGRNNASSSLKEPKVHLELWPEVTFQEVIGVQCSKLDTWYAQNLRPRVIDLIMCDVNGGEQGVLDGGWVTLDMKTRFLYIEFCERELYEGAMGKDEIIKQLPNFDVVGVYNFQGNFGDLLLRNSRFT